MAKRKESYLCKTATLCIKKYLTRFYDNLSIEGNHKLSHKQLDTILFDKGYELNRRAAFKNISDDDVLCGRVVLVKDDFGDIAPYMVSFCFDKYCVEITVPDKIRELTEKRREILREMGYQYDEFGDEVIEMPDDLITVQQSNLIDFPKSTNEEVENIEDSELKEVSGINENINRYKQHVYSKSGNRRNVRY